MRYLVILSILAFGLVATAAETADYAAVQAKFIAAQEALAKAKAELQAKWEASPEFKSMRADVDAKKTALTIARAGEDSRAKLDASGAYNMAKLKLDKATAAAMAPTPQIRQLEAELTSAEAALREAAKVKAVQDAAAAAKREAEEKVARMREIEAKAPAITAKQLETVGERYKGQIVKLVGFEFRDASNTWVDQLPGVTLRSNGLVSIISKTALEKWVGFSAEDETDSTQFLYADKAEWADFILGLKRGEKINLYGFVVELDHAGWYGVVCYRIEKPGAKPAGPAGQVVPNVQEIKKGMKLAEAEAIAGTKARLAGKEDDYTFYTLSVWDRSDPAVHVQYAYELTTVGEEIVSLSMQVNRQRPRKPAAK